MRGTRSWDPLGMIPLCHKSSPFLHCSSTSISFSLSVQSDGTTQWMSIFSNEAFVCKNWSVYTNWVQVIFFFFCFTYFRHSQVGLWYNVLEKKSAFSQTCYETVNYIWSCSRFSKLGPSWASRVIRSLFSSRKISAIFLPAISKIKPLVESFCI